MVQQLAKYLLNISLCCIKVDKLLLKLNHQKKIPKQIPHQTHTKDQIYETGDCFLLIGIHSIQG